MHGHIGPVPSFCPFRQPTDNPVKQAFILKGLLDQGTYATQAYLAEHLGMSRARVTQTFNLLKLAPEILDALMNLPDDQVHLFSKRRLRPITQISSPKRQTLAFRNMCARLRADGPLTESQSFCAQINLETSTRTC